MKKLLCILLATVLTLGLCIPASADAAYTKQADALNALGLFQGTDQGYELEASLTREQGVVMILRLLGKEKEAADLALPHPFTDVGDHHWVDAYLGYAYRENITKGIGETTFGYGEPMSDAMYLTMLLRVLGYADSNDGTGDFTWDAPYELAKSAGICDGTKREDFLRDDMVLFSWNALGAKCKGSDKTLADALAEDAVLTPAAYAEALKAISGSSAEEQPKPTTGGGSSSGGSSTPSKPSTPEEKEKEPEKEPEKEQDKEKYSINKRENETPPMPLP